MAEFPKKYQKYLGEFEDKANSMNTKELEQELVQAERAMNAIEKDIENDPKIQAAKAELEDYSKDYKDLLKQHKAIIKYVVFLLDERGVVTGGNQTNKP